MTAVSVIVPLYQVEPFLPACVDSILCQSLQDLEVVLVDDGSPDRCAELAERFGSRDGRVRVVRRENGGLGAARNSGLEVARGDYVAFVDGDDWIDEDMYRALYDRALSEGADAVFSGYRVVSRGVVGGEFVHPWHGARLSGDDELFAFRRSFFGAAPHRGASDSVPVSVCFSLYRRSIIEDGGIRFPDFRSEDRFFNTRFCRKARAVSFSEGVFYNYRNDGQPSITGSFSAEVVDDHARMFEALRALAGEEPEGPRKNEALQRVRRSVVDCTRAVVCAVAASDCDGATKVGYVRAAFRQSAVSQACTGYPVWRLSIKQQVFWCAVRLKLPRLALLLARVRTMGERN